MTTTPTSITKDILICGVSYRQVISLNLFYSVYTNSISYSPMLELARSPFPSQILIPYMLVKSAAYKTAFSEFSWVQVQTFEAVEVYSISAYLSYV